MKTAMALLAAGACVLLGTGVWAAPLATVKGVVTDEAGNPLEGVRVQLCGMETLQDGVWRSESRSGVMPWWTTDKHGRFTIEFGEPDIRYDLWFEKRGFAPTFLYGISAKSEELKVVLEKGVVVTGTVTRLVEGREKPVEGAEVVLSGPSTDLMYRQESLTDPDGRYRFRASPAPKGKNWSVLFLNEGVDLEIGDEAPVAGPDFVVRLEVRKAARTTIRLTADRRVWSEGDDPRFTVVVRNTGRRTLLIRATCSLVLEVDGKAFGPKVWHRTGKIGRKTFEPGDEHTFAVSLGGFGSFRSPHDRDGDVLPRGKHTIRAVFLDNIRGDAISASLEDYRKRALGFSNVVEIEVIAKAEL